MKKPAVAVLFALLTVGAVRAGPSISTGTPVRFGTETYVPFLLNNENRDTVSVISNWNNFLHTVEFSGTVTPDASGQCGQWIMGDVWQNGQEFCTSTGYGGCIQNLWWQPPAERWFMGFGGCLIGYGPGTCGEGKSGTMGYLHVFGDGAIRLYNGAGGADPPRYQWQTCDLSGPQEMMVDTSWVQVCATYPYDCGASGGGGSGGGPCPPGHICEEGLRVGTPPVPKTKTTWGQLKAIYR